MDMTIDRIKEENGMTDLKGSKTYENLLIAFAGESQARNKYTFFASKAREEGYMQAYLRTRQPTKRNMLSCGSSTSEG